MTEELRRTSLYEEHLRLGARMVPFAGWEMPVQYAGVMEEHHAVRQAAGIFDVGHMGEFRVFGFGAFDFLQRMLTNDLRRISELGHAQYTLLCNEQGGIIDDLIVYHSGDLEYLIVANAGNRERDLEWLTAHCPQGVEIADESDRTGLIAVQGPKALEIVGELVGAGWEAPSRFTLGEATLDSIPTLVARTGYTGEDGVEIFCRATDAPRLWCALLSFPEVVPAGLGARDTLRLEVGYPLHGQDIGPDTDPISAGLGWVVGKDKGEFIGRESIEAVRAAKPSKKLVGLTVGEGVPRAGYAVLHESQEVGKVASGTFSPTLGHGIALAYVPLDLTEPGTRLEIALRRKPVSAVVERPPFVKETSLKAQ